MKVTMRYGKNGLNLDLPEDWEVTVIGKKPMRILEEPVESVRHALLNPVGSKPLRAEAEGCKTACIVICDITRPVPNSLILQPMIRDLIEAGIDARSITVLIATGLHRPNEGDELRELIGDEWVLSHVNIVNHFARNDEDHVYLGRTSRGIPARLDRRFVDADLRIVAGLVEPHFMAGYSGGRKLIAPGIAHYGTISRLHSARILEHPKAANCILDGNPLHEEQLEIVDMLDRVLALNVVLDDQRRLSFVNYGDIKAGHGEAVSYLKTYAEIRVDRKFATVITSAAGYPLDKTYYQTVKGMVAAMGILKPGGNLFIVSECSEGIGSDEYRCAQSKLARMGESTFMAHLLAKEYASVDEWQTEMQLKPMRVGNVHLYTGSPYREELETAGVHLVNSLNEAVQRSVEESNDPKVAVIPEGPYVIPYCR